MTIIDPKQQLIQFEKKWQAVWEQNKQFESNPPPNFTKGDARKKYFVTFPYPYMNGRLHLGHLFTVSKSEFAAGYHQMAGDETLFPFAFHVTGQPICGAAKRLEQEMQKYGCPPIYVEDEEPVAQAVKVEKEMNLGQFKAKKTKTAQKSSTKFTYDILRDLGVPAAEIPEFVDPYKWVRFFPELCIADMKQFGARVDWRRSFITSDANPVYDAFIRWQFSNLKRGGYVKFGERNCIWSPADAQPCMDHDRLSGEGIQVQEYVVVLTEVIREHTNNQQIMKLVKENEHVYLACATLRPETMCGQTNVWVKPDGEYVVFRAGGDRVIITGQQAAYNMSFQKQNNGKPMGEIDEVTRIQGNELLNCVICAPLTPYKQIPVLPLLTISMTKGTGVVTSVPSDAPDDYAALKDVMNNYDGIVDKYKLDLNLMKNITPIEIIEIPELGRSAAAKLCEDRGVKSQNDRELLKELKDICYSRGFYEGVMVSGPFSGHKVQECKVLCKNYLIERGQAFVYGEPEAEIVARSGCVCVVATTEQYFMDYGEEKWKAAALSALKNVDCFTDEVRHHFERVLEWLKQWALSRTFGLGTRIPWDEKYLIESLSDSTIYNAFYTLAVELQNGNLYGNGCPVAKEHLNDAFFDFVFDLRQDISPELHQYEALMRKLRQSFTFYYPVDMRCSGKDLVPNHLTFFIYNHCAIWSQNPEYWPRGIRANGHLMLNDSKMSKSSGNFLTAVEAVEKFSADGVRLALADAGDGADDANFKTEVAEQAAARLIGLMKANQELLEKSEEREPKFTRDMIFQAQFWDCAKRADAAYSRCLFREGTIITLNEMVKARDMYMRTCAEAGGAVCRQLIKDYVHVQTQLLAVICPHIAEEINEVQLKATKSIFKDFINTKMLEEMAFRHARHLNTYDFVLAMVARLKMRYNDCLKLKKDVSKPRTGTVYVATEFLAWQAGIIEWLGASFKNGFDKNTIGAARQHALDNLGVEAKDAKKLVKFVTDVIALSKTDGEEAFVVKMPFDEREVYREYGFLILQSLSLEKVDIFQVGEGPVAAEKCVAAQPGRPIIFFDL